MNTSTNEVCALSPQKVWTHFAHISQIPRGSGNENAIQNYIIQLARKHNLFYKQDRIGNVLVRKPAKGTGTSLDGYVLQAHTDMVCEKNADTPHDFKTDPIELIINGAYLSANNTTLGADNGIGVAYMLTLMESINIEHAPLEFLFTVDEETGLTGASKLELYDDITYRQLLNIDTEEETHLCIGCAGMYTCENTIPIHYEPAPDNVPSYQIKLHGLFGGHSGIDIHKQRGCVIKDLTRILLYLIQKDAIRLQAYHGSGRRNAIVREFFADICVLNEKEFHDGITYWQDILSAEYSHNQEANPIIHINPIAPLSHFITTESQNRLLAAIMAYPHGIYHLSNQSNRMNIHNCHTVIDAIGQVVSVSSNLANISCTETHACILISIRFDEPSKGEELLHTMHSITNLANGTVSIISQSNAWPAQYSTLHDTCITLYKQYFDKDPIVFSVHAGLECGIISSHYTDMHAISFGPNIYSPHTPQEKTEIASVARIWEFLKRVVCQ